MNRLWLTAALLLTEPALVRADDAAEPMVSVVTGSRTERRVSEAPVTTEVIDRKEIRRSDATDASRLLENHPGIQINRTYAGAGILIEGLDPKRVLVLVDGERSSFGLRAFDLSQVTLEDVERIEIVKGAASALYGSDAMGGVVNIIPRPCSHNEYEVRAQGSSILQGDLTATSAWHFPSGCFRLSGALREAPRLSLGLPSPITAVDGIIGGQLGARGEWEPSDAFRLVLSVDGVANDMTGVDGGIGGAVFDRTGRLNTVNATLRPEWSFGDAGRFKVSLRQSWYRQQLLQDQRGSSELDQFTDTSAQIWQLTTQYDRTFIDRHRFIVGAEGFLNDLHASTLAGGKALRWRGAVFAQDEWRIIDDHPVIIVPSVRADADSQFGFWPSPRLAVRWDPALSVTLHGGAGLGFRAPGFEELYLLFMNPSVGYRVDGNPQLKPEYLRNEQIGVEWRPHDVIAATLDLYDNGISNLINVTTRPSIGDGTTHYTYGNVAQAITRGGEAGVRLRPVSGLRVDLSYGYLYAWDVSANRALEGRSPHRVSARISYQHRPWGLEGSLRGTWASARPFYSSDGTTRQAAAYTTLDVRISKKVIGPLSLFLGGDNLLNAGDPSDLPIPPRNFYCGLLVRSD